MSTLTKRKIASLTENGEMMQSGAVLVNTNTGQRAIVEMGAVRWMTNDEFYSLMHPKGMMDAVEYAGRTFALTPCPWCRAGTFQIRSLGRIWNGTKYGPPSSYEVIHHCEPTEGQPSRAIIRVGRDLESAVYAWNTRKC